MIHSTSGGVMYERKYYDYAKVEVNGKNYFYISPFKDLKEGDIVSVTIQNEVFTGKVIRVDKNVSEQNFPISAKKLKKIIEIIKKVEK